MWKLAYRITFKSFARRYLELYDEIADLDIIIGALVDEFAPDLVARNSIGHVGAAQLLLAAGVILIGSNPRPALPPPAGPVRFPPHPAKPSGTASTEAAIGIPAYPQRLAHHRDWSLTHIRKPGHT